MGSVILSLADVAQLEGIDSLLASTDGGRYVGVTWEGRRKLSMNTFTSSSDGSDEIELSLDIDVSVRICL